MDQLNRFHAHFKNDSSSDSEEEEMFSNHKKMKTNSESIEDNNESSHQLFAKNAFKPSKSLQIKEFCVNQSKKRFSIWSDILMEEDLNHNINNSMNIKTNSNSNRFDRKSENYSFWTKKQLENKSSDQRLETNSTNELSLNCDNNFDNNNERRSKKRKKKNKNKKKGKERQKIALEIAFKLNEPKVDLIKRTIEAIGENKALELCSSTLNIESAGGLMTNNGSRRRSPGGVFFHLLKNDPKITKESIDYIFFEEQQAFKQKKKVIKRAKRKTLNKLNKSLINSLNITENKVKLEGTQSMTNEEIGSLEMIPSETINSCN